MPRLVLASASPRRVELLGRLGVPFRVEPSGIDEVVRPGAGPEETAVTLAAAKAGTVAARQAGPAVVLGADTLVVLDGRMLGKPADRADARTMLRALRGRTHVVVTGLAAVLVPGPAGGPGRTLTAHVESRVTMRPCGDDEIEGYLDTGEHADKAGAYAVQGAGGQLVAGVAGCYTNVVGLPLTTAAGLLQSLGVPVVRPAPPAPPGS